MLDSLLAERCIRLLSVSRQSCCTMALTRLAKQAMLNDRFNKRPLGRCVKGTHAHTQQLRLITPLRPWNPCLINSLLERFHLITDEFQEVGFDFFPLFFADGPLFFRGYGGAVGAS